MNEINDPDKIPDIITGRANINPFNWLLKTCEKVNPRIIWLNVTGRVSTRHIIYNTFTAPIER